MEKATNAIGSAADLERELKDRFDDYAALAVRVYERCLFEGNRPLAAPLTVGEGSIRVEVERSKKHKPENIG